MEDSSPGVVARNLSVRFPTIRAIAVRLQEYPKRSSDTAKRPLTLRMAEQYSLRPYICSYTDIIKLDPNQIATAQLVVDCQVEKCTISQAPFSVGEGTAQIHFW